jgi:hypothetical protein
VEALGYRYFLTSLAILALLLLSTFSLACATLHDDVQIGSGPITEIHTTTNSSKSNLRFYDDLIVWEEHSKIKVHNLTSGLEYNVSDYDSYQNHPDIWGNFIVWMDERNTNLTSDQYYDIYWNQYDIYIKDILTDEEYEITFTPMEEEHWPKIYGNYVLYSSGNYSTSENKLALFDLTTKQKITVINDSINPHWSHYSLISNKILNSQYVVVSYNDPEDGLGHLILYEIATGNFSEIVSSPDIERLGRFEINERYVVWSDSNFFFDLAKRKVVEVEDKTPIVYSLSNDKIVSFYHPYIKNLYGLEIYNLTLGKTFKIPISQSETYRYIQEPRIFGDKIVFMMDVENPRHYEMYLYDLTWDTDDDGIPDYMDEDSDNDGYNDSLELSVGTAIWSDTSVPNDLDGDNIPDELDDDLDGDNVTNKRDAFPEDPDRWEYEYTDDDDYEPFAGFQLSMPPMETSLLVLGFFGLLMIVFIFGIIKLDKYFSNLSSNSFLVKIEKRKRVIIFEIIYFIIYLAYILIIMIFFMNITISLLFLPIIFFIVLIPILLIWLKYTRKHIFSIRFEYNSREYYGFILQNLAVNLIVWTIWFIGYLYIYYQVVSPGIILFMAGLIFLFYVIGEFISNLKVPDGFEIKKIKISVFLIGALLTLLGVVLIYVLKFIVDGNISISIPSDRIFEGFLFFLIFACMVGFLAFGITFMIIAPFYLVYTITYAHPELLEPDVNHKPYLQNIGRDKYGKINGAIVKSVFNYSNMSLGSDTTFVLLNKAGLPRSITMWKKYPLDQFLVFLDGIKNEIKQDSETFHDAWLANYYRITARGAFGRGIIKFLDYRSIVEINLRTYHLVSNKGFLYLVRMTENEALINYYVEKDYVEMVKIIVSMLGIMLKLNNRSSKIKASEIGDFKDAKAFRIVITFIKKGDDSLLNK